MLDRADAIVYRNGRFAGGKRMKKAFTWLLTFFFFSISITAYAEQAKGKDRGRFEAGFITGYGGGGMCDGSYEPLLLILHLGYTVKEYSFKSGRTGRLSLFLEPQYNPVFRPRSEYEFGLGFGIKYMHSLTQRLDAYVLAAAGPHYISLQSNDQATGFIFSNTFSAGFYYFLKPNLAVDAGYRLRHISNAGTRRPNIGIDTHFGAIGISWFF